MEEGLRRNKVEPRDRAMNRIISLYMKIENKSSAFGIKESSRVDELTPKTLSSLCCE